MFRKGFTQSHTNALLFAYVMAIPLTKLVWLPKIGYKLQLTEILFVAAFVAWFFSSVKSLQFPSLNKLSVIDFGALALLFTNFIWALYHATFASWVEFLSIFYLVSLYKLVSISCRSQRSWTWDKAIYSMGWVAIATVAISLFIFQLFGPTAIELVEPKYLPSLGWINRVEALTMSPNMLANILMLCVFVGLGKLLFDKTLAKERVAYLLLIFFGVLMTFSKSIVLIIAGIIWLLSSKATIKGLRIVAYTGALILIGIYLGFSQFLIVPNAEEKYLAEQSYSAGQQVATIDDYVIMKNTNFLLKEEAVQAFLSSPLWGIGGGQFPDWLEWKRSKGEYPSKLPLYDPHSPYFGTIAEQGLVGGIGLIIFLCCLFTSFFQRANLESGLLGILAFLLIFFIDSMTMDTLHFRQFWIALGVFEAGYYKNRLGL